MADSTNTAASGSQAVSRYEAAKAELVKALQLGIEAECDDPELGPVVSTLSGQQIDWVAAWLAGEGFARPVYPTA